MGATDQGDVCHAVDSAEAERVTVVKLEAPLLGTPSTAVVHVAAPVSIAVTHGTPNSRGDVFAADLRPPEATSLEPFEFLSDGLLEDDGEIAVLPSETHQGSQALHLVAELGASRELHLVPTWGQGLDDGGRYR